MAEATVTTSASAAVTVTVSYQQVETSGERRTPVAGSVRSLLQLLSGSDPAQINRIHDSVRTLVATSENLDLYGGLTDLHGEPLNAAKIRALYVENMTQDSGKRLILGGAVANAWQTWTPTTGGRVYVEPGCSFLLASKTDGYSVTAGTGDILKVDAATNTIQYRLIILAVSA